MSIVASIEISLVEDKTRSISAVNVINVLKNFGWSLVHDNHTSYLPIGDKDDFDWQSEKNMDFLLLAKIIVQKEAAGELIGLILTWQTSDIGIVFLFYMDKTISISASINRQTIALANNYAITDFQWYLEKLLLPLNEAFGVEYFSCEQSK
jgi:hypothetical protein